MQHYRTDKAVVKRIDSIECDCCGRQTPASDTEEFEEYLRIEFEAGFGSRIFPDEARIRGDFCQDCVHKLLGKYLRAEERETSLESIEALLRREGFRPVTEEEKLFLKANGLYGMPDE